VTVCGKAAAATLRPDGITIDVTAPDCPLGWAEVQVCTTGGCDSRTQGFRFLRTFVRGETNEDGTIDLSDAIGIIQDFFLGEPAKAPCRDALDTDDSGVLDLTDGIYLLTYLFLSGTPPKPPHPDAGFDPTPDDALPPCD